ncbi:hypothetical protein, variant [Aphanomyces invadans]|uniref:Uncharacterized protein n=1 Tax=Aphanomyces invadans TaxID=157072 RepID=A0A024UNL8_9STRA|nr:hypothetical protein, variant [Aphanomyces invadans]ETW07785.1 hypothetical protein, variant [Aphanomyces invadans]|eukprot:XP_008863878.1 hypothetical protein, variant [Aphanomyces invadans]
MPTPQPAVRPVDVEDVDVGAPCHWKRRGKRKSIAEHLQTIPAVLSHSEPSPRRSSTLSYHEEMDEDATAVGDGRVRRKRLALVSSFLQQLQLDVVIHKSKVESLEGDSSNVSALRLVDIKARVGDWTLDEVYRVKNVRILINAMGGLALALLELYVSWMNKVMLDDNNKVIAILDVPTSPLSNWLKIAMSVLSFVLVVQIGDLYRQFFNDACQWERTFQQDTARMQRTLFPKTRASSERTVRHAVDRTVVWMRSVGLTIKKYLTSSLTWSCVAEMTIAAIHPPPYVDSIVHLTAACLMFFRLYLFCRVYRDHSKVYRQRRDILMNCFLHTTNPTFDWFLSIKIDFGKSPLQFILTLFLCVLFILTVCIHVFEREYQPQVFTMANSVWYTFCTLTTHVRWHVGRTRHSLA